MDFTLTKYKELLTQLQKAGFLFQPFQDFVSKQEMGKIISLRHDVDLLPENSLQTAIIEHELGIAGTYYFRSVPESWDKEIILELHKLGHEVGYHYETMDEAYKNLKTKEQYIHTPALNTLHEPNLQPATCNLSHIDLAYSLFCQHLEEFRKLVSVSTVCMHGSPKSKYDNKDIWKKYDYKKLDIIGEPYFDIDFSNTFYLTDTGRRWDGYKVSVRDKIPIHQDKWIKEGLVFHSTDDIIKAAKEDKLPNRIMITVHPQRWHNKPLPWAKELILQNLKNIVKRVIVARKK